MCESSCRGIESYLSDDGNPPLRVGFIADWYYYVMTESQPILALLIYGKNEQADLSPAQRKIVAALAAELKQGAAS
jgi:hypothetical protein